MLPQSSTSHFLASIVQITGSRKAACEGQHLSKAPVLSQKHIKSIFNPVANDLKNHKFVWYLLVKQTACLLQPRQKSNPSYTLDPPRCEQSRAHSKSALALHGQRDKGGLNISEPENGTVSARCYGEFPGAFLGFVGRCMGKTFSF